MEIILIQLAGMLFMWGYLIAEGNPLHNWKDGLASLFLVTFWPVVLLIEAGRVCGVLVGRV